MRRGGQSLGLDSFFKIKERKSSVGTEVLGGMTTYREHYPFVMELNLLAFKAKS